MVEHFEGTQAKFLGLGVEALRLLKIFPTPEGEGAGFIYVIKPDGTGVLCIFSFSDRLAVYSIVKFALC